MRLFLTQDDIDEFYLSRPELSLSENFVRPLSEFPGDVWSDCDFEQLTLGDLPLYDLCEWSYSVPNFCTESSDIFCSLDDSPPRIPVVLQSRTPVQPTAKTWTTHLKHRNSSGIEYVFGVKTAFKDAESDFGVLANHQHKSNFAVIADPYLFAEQSSDVAAARQVATILAQLITPSDQTDFTLLIAARWRWSSWEQGQHVPRELLDPVATEEVFRQHLAKKGLAQSVTVCLLNSDALKKVPRSPRFHDRYLLTQQYTLNAGQGFALPRGTNRYTRIDVRYHAGSRRDLRSFCTRFNELIHFLETCKALDQPDSAVSSATVTTQLKRLRRAAEQSMGTF